MQRKARALCKTRDWTVGSDHSNHVSLSHFVWPLQRKGRDLRKGAPAIRFWRTPLCTTLLADSREQAERFQTTRPMQFAAIGLPRTSGRGQVCTYPSNLVS